MSSMPSARPRRPRHLLRKLLFSVTVFLVASGDDCLATAQAAPARPQQPQATGSQEPSKTRDPQDGALDISGFLDTAYGFVPLVIPITEPAVGYGAAGGLVFIRRKESESGTPLKPSLTMLGGMGTQNGSWATFGGYTDSWFDGALETFVAGVYGSINLDYFGIGKDSALQQSPIGYTLEPAGGIAEARYRLGSSPVQIGLGYGFADTRVSFDGGTLPPPVSMAELDSRIAGLTPAVILDTRDSIFTPSHGTYARVEYGAYREAFGGSFDFDKPSVICLQYLPLGEKVTLGIKAEATSSSAGTPFYARPFVQLRGVAIRRYVGEEAADTEVEARWQAMGRFSLVGFTGAGIAWNDLERLHQQETVFTGGVGLRYEIARKYGLHMGLDVAFGPDEPVLYVIFGNAWFRP